jgi:hypothetical protein
MQETARGWEGELSGLHERLGKLFKRSEPRQRSLAYLRGLLSGIERKNGWQLAEWIGEATPDGIESPRESRRLVGLSHAALRDSFNCW